GARLSKCLQVRLAKLCLRLSEWLLGCGAELCRLELALDRLLLIKLVLGRLGKLELGLGRLKLELVLLGKLKLG
ncbi:MAG: hypothetical protein ACKO96_21295, partial [Flammeovirgaceae bacterium]